MGTAFMARNEVVLSFNQAGNPAWRMDKAAMPLAGHIWCPCCRLLNGSVRAGRDLPYWLQPASAWPSRSGQEAAGSESKPCWHQSFPESEWPHPPHWPAYRHIYHTLRRGYLAIGCKRKFTLRNTFLIWQCPLAFARYMDLVRGFSLPSDKV